MDGRMIRSAIRRTILPDGQYYNQLHTQHWRTGLFKRNSLWEKTLVKPSREATAHSVGDPDDLYMNASDKELSIGLGSAAGLWRKFNPISAAAFLNFQAEFGWISDQAGDDHI